MLTGSRFRRTFIGDRAFYKAVVLLVIPIIIQNSISNIVNLLDNLMVGQVGTDEMSGVAVANQLIFVFNLCIFGGLSGPGIFGAQFYGAGDMEGLRNTFRIKIWITLTVFAIAMVAFVGWGEALIRAFLTGEGEASAAATVFGSAKEYLVIMLAGLLPFALAQCYSGTLRETGESVLPMWASIAAVLTNLVGNWILIYGNLGFPRLGVAGAAIATVISRFVELGIMVAAVYRQPAFSFLKGVYRTLHVPAALFKQVMQKGAPLLINETLWSAGVTVLMQIYSVRGLVVLAGLNIAGTITNLFNVVLMSMGNAVAVIVGQALGANELARARGDAWKLMFFNFSSCVVVGGILAILSPVLPHMYPTTDEVYRLASLFILTAACMMPINAITHCSYFTLRSGGSVMITFLFDSAFSWIIAIPFAAFLAYGTGLPILALYPISQGIELIKSAIGVVLVKKGVWIRNMVSAPPAEAEKAV